MLTVWDRCIYQQCTYFSVITCTWVHAGCWERSGRITSYRCRSGILFIVKEHRNINIYALEQSFSFLYRLSKLESGFSNPQHAHGKQFTIEQESRLLERCHNLSVSRRVRYDSRIRNDTSLSWCWSGRLNTVLSR